MTDWARIQTRETGEGVTGYSVQAEALGLGGPGVAEALVLAGQVRVGHSPDWASPDLTSPDLWASCPRPEGSQ